MKRRGMTLVEVLAAIALLGVLFVAAVGWMRLMAHVADGPLRNQEWRRAAATALARVGEDLHSFDQIEETRSGRQSSRVRMAPGGRLLIDTRVDGVGAARREYATAGSTLVRRTFRLNGARERGALVEERTMLRGVASARIVIDAERRVLSITLNAAGHDETALLSMNRRWKWIDAYE
ncbi:MAG: type II secretion system protein [Phycisphaerales bacterium]